MKDISMQGWNEGTRGLSEIHHQLANTSLTNSVSNERVTASTLTSSSSSGQTIPVSSEHLSRLFIPRQPPTPRLTHASLAVLSPPQRRQSWNFTDILPLEDSTEHLVNNASISSNSDDSTRGTTYIRGDRRGHNPLRQLNVWEENVVAANVESINDVGNDGANEADNLVGDDVGPREESERGNGATL